ncbi:MAG TPA: ATP-dependent DNA helicase RecG [Beijerinckiaceae bacterium]|jgi:ATP-dependent DNA helicase RecG|nr:ATP-dependent DNA helicase RecG [Beijerinckiaceae bacterium]
MRPSLLDPLFASVSALAGVGSKSALLFDRLLAPPGGAARIIDLLFHVPYDTIDRRARPKIIDAEIGKQVVLDVRVTEHRSPGGRYAKGPYRVHVEDDTGDVQLVFFMANVSWIEKSLPVGARRFVSGRLELYDGYRQIVHPDRVLDAENVRNLAAVEPVYGATEGLQPRAIARAIDAALQRVPQGIPEWLEPSFVAAQNFPAFADALDAIHHPADPDAIKPESTAYTRLAYDELLSQQLALRLVRARMRRSAGRASRAEGTIIGKIEAALPFSLTCSQREALAEIRADLASDKRMLRLLQGDVGSGKTLVALMAMAHIVEAGAQAAMMAPTEILARQHFARVAPLAEAAGLRIALLTGRDKAAERARTLEGLAAGHIDIAVGTHALIEEGVAFRDLALAVVDEQHRFGVHQRLALGEKGAAADILVMTATPIPRTLVLTYFGDMDASSLTEKPAGRQPIDTRAVPSERIGDVIEAIGRAMQNGARIYWVCPLVEESETTDLAAATERHADLKRIFGKKVGLVHGRMKGTDKDEAMARFQRGDTQILVATTVIEVGVDVPEATIMVIEHAERFGLAQLHQLRGRVGRGEARSSCILLYKGPLNENAKARLETLRETEDGFRIAEMDLKLRGEGEVLGTRQSGAPGFRIARLDVHAHLLGAARDDGELILRNDPDLKSARGRALRVLLYLFGRDEAVRLLRSG